MIVFPSLRSNGLRAFSEHSVQGRLANSANLGPRALLPLCRTSCWTCFGSVTGNGYQIAGPMQVQSIAQKGDLTTSVHVFPH